MKKRHFSKLTVVLLVALLAAPAMLIAQDRDNGGDRSNFAQVARVLDLTEAQQEQWTEILQDRNENLRPLAEELRRLASQLSDATDPTDIGELTLQIRDLRGEIRDERAAAGEALLAVLDDEQTATVERATNISRRYRALRVGAMESLGLISNNR